MEEGPHLRVIVSSIVGAGCRVDDVRGYNVALGRVHKMINRWIACRLNRCKQRLIEVRIGFSPRLAEGRHGLTFGGNDILPVLVMIIPLERLAEELAREPDDRGIIVPASTQRGARGQASDRGLRLDPGLES